MAFDPSYGDAIASIESGGNYGAVGPATSGGDRAYGKYQIMGANIPQWTREHIGQELTPEQFLANPQIQDAVFQARFGQYVDKYGPEGAAKAWFAGEKGMNNPNAKDVLGTSVSSYAAKFMKGLGQPQPPQQVAQGPDRAPLGGVPVPAATPDMPAYGWTPPNNVAPEQQQNQFATAQPPAAPATMPINYAPRRPPDPAQIQALLKLNPAIAPGFRFLRTT